MGDPCDENLRNHSKCSRRRFYTLWAISGRTVDVRKASTRVLQQLNRPAHCLVDVSGGDDLDFKVIPTELMSSPAFLLNDYLFITMGLAKLCTIAQRILDGVRNINPEAFSD